MIDVAVAIDLEETTVVRKRTLGGAYEAGGRWVDGTEESYSFKAEVQPTTGRQLMDLPEGVRSEARCTLWTRETDLLLDDVVAYEGLDYRVVYVWNRQRSGNYTRCVLGLLSAPPPSTPTPYKGTRR